MRFYNTFIKILKYFSVLGKLTYGRGPGSKTRPSSVVFASTFDTPGILLDSIERMLSKVPSPRLWNFLSDNLARWSLLLYLIIRRGKYEIGNY